MANGHGGARPGAGRKKGELNVKQRAVVALMNEMNFDPIKEMITITQRLIAEGNPENDGRIFAQCESLAPYVAPKLKAVELTGAEGEDLEIVVKMSAV